MLMRSAIAGTDNGQSVHCLAEGKGVQDVVELSKVVQAPKSFKIIIGLLLVHTVCLGKLGYQSNGIPHPV